MSYSRAEGPIYARPRPERPSGRGGRDPAPETAGAGEVAPAQSQDQPQTAAPERGLAAKGLPILTTLFILTLLMPIQFRIGPVLLLPYRAWLLVLFIPLFIRLMSGRAGGLIAPDWMILVSALWTGVALAVNHPIGFIIEPWGTNLIEFFGAYMLGRVGVRNADDFRLMAKTTFFVLLVLLPFAILEAVTHRAVLLSKLPGHIEIVNPTPRYGLRRVQSVFAHPIHYGAFASTTFGLAWFVVSYGGALFTRIWRALLVALSTFLSLSTGGLIAFIIQFGLIAYEMVMKSNPRRWRIFAWMAVIGYILANFMAEKSVFHTLVFKATFSAQSGYTRILIFEHGMKNVWANPIFGIGYNNWVRPSFMSDSVDNFWLLYAMQFGLPAFVLLAGALALIVWRAIQAPLPPGGLDWACRAGFLVSLSGIIIAGGTVHYWKGLLSFVMFFIGTGVWIFTGGARTAPAAAPVEEADRRPAGPRKAAPLEAQPRARRT